MPFCDFSLPKSAVDKMIQNAPDYHYHYNSGFYILWCLLVIRDYAPIKILETINQYGFPFGILLTVFPYFYKWHEYLCLC